MKSATFYILETDTLSAGLTPVEALTCHLAAERWRMGKRILIACDSQAQAERLDEALWAREASSFVPHSLVGEGPKYGAPVELCWPGKRSNMPRDLLINLQIPFPDFATAFYEVVDFVPHEDSLKQQARERYKVYRSVGFNLSTATPPTF